MHVPSREEVETWSGLIILRAVKWDGARVFPAAASVVRASDFTCNKAPMTIYIAATRISSATGTPVPRPFTFIYGINMRMPRLFGRFRAPLAGAGLLAGATVLAAASSATPLAAQIAPAGASQSAEDGRVVSAIEAVFRAAESGDLTALDSLYAGSDLTVIESTGINRGWADFRDHHLAPELKNLKNFRYRPFEIEPHVSGSLAWAIFRYELRAELDGRPLDLVGRGTAVLEKKGNRWVVRHTHTASRARRPTDPASKP